MAIILAGDFNLNAKDNYNAELEFLKESFELDVLLDLSQGTTRSISLDKR
jgi:hypothetical protein